MRTTIDIDQDAILVIKKYAADRSISLGRAVSDLVHRGAESIPDLKTHNGWAVFDLPPGTPPLTNDALDEWEREADEEEIRSALSPGR